MEGKTRALAFRKTQLQALAAFLMEQEEGLVTALKADFKSHFEAVAEVKAVQTEVAQAIDQLSTWTQPVSVSTPVGKATRGAPATIIVG